ncbi:cytochrome-c oxidase, cbb3-type subunit III [Salipiger bermudensis]|uniref:Cbb3-type cytochrome c oxidase subunit n=1 Tax=Salipiger bermudensis (strain DSM 26914 / JCM 13377 / KCTC 12554 / HTCC2601) TaxID=314265 RepID=Q0FNK6_SALBH|nr:cytochrome-c oxidase, cbb3-type subunit III [Salipiger bermudensis]EAU45738.1 cytochrome c oxidase, cbb3-type, subunit III [Salipiger bermudensis HTCC2601]MBN9676531.1 cytochrome-c oxidase, cbb3-type subunit III [Salipiger bermudensis]MBR9890988.1 cytochrome-c oxidase, cbb3-type subunit III [bacterium]MCA1287353.1 cytochrome-c oxidase, cbb3-type subunit III [Salipiger bermudensis]
MSDNNKKDDQDYETTGHSWDGIEEYNKPLPKWWLMIFYACIVWGVGYTIAYPAWPGVRTATAGLLGWSTRGNVEQAIQDHEAELAPINERLASAELTEIAGDPELNTYAQNAGAAVFRTWCAQCHGSGAAGAKGYPNLLDDDWLWGGTIEDIHYTVTAGIRNEDTDEEWLRQSAMPAFGRDDLLSGEEIDQVVNFVMTLSGEEPRDASLVEAGAEVYDINCASCHAEDGTGDRMQGAPNLTDAIWLYGGDYETLHETVYNARYGVMPAMGGADLSEAEIRAVATYVHGLGGGE